MSYPPLSEDYIKEYWEEGTTAFRQSKTLYDNPYFQGQVAFNTWRRSFLCTQLYEERDQS